MKVVFTPAARSDVLGTAVYLAQEAYPSVANRYIDAVRKTTRWISANPHIGSRVLTTPPKLRGLRRWPVKGFESIGIYYQETLRVIRVVRILHSKRDIRRILSA